MTRFAKPPRGFQADLDALPDDATRVKALEMAVLVRDGKVRGHSLDDRVATGDLSDCFKLYFDTVGGIKPRFRLVYRECRDGVQLVAVQPDAVGFREGLDAYTRAAKNLGR